MYQPEVQVSASQRLANHAGSATWAEAPKPARDRKAEVGVANNLQPLQLTSFSVTGSKNKK